MAPAALSFGGSTNRQKPVKTSPVSSATPMLCVVAGSSRQPTAMLRRPCAHLSWQSFSIAARLRAMGYAGRLRAAGPLIADQFRAARRVGFDEIELPDAMAERQPEPQWRLRPQGSYQQRLTA